MAVVPNPSSCPCGRADLRARPLPYSQCCGRYLYNIEGAAAPDPESLMRSRYTAFAKERADYLLATWHVSTRPAEVTFEPDMRWLGLEVRSRSMSDGEHAEVEFVARQRNAAGQASRLQERSRFVRENERWYYVDGEAR